MKILTRNFENQNADAMNGLEKAAAISPEAIIEKVSIAGLREHGVYSGRIVADEWRTRGGSITYAALNNCDLDYVALSLALRDPLSVAVGAAIAARATGAVNVEIYLPDESDALLAGLAEAFNQVCGYVPELKYNLKLGQLDIRETGKFPLIHHLGTLAEITALFTLDDKFIHSRLARFMSSGFDSGVVEIPMGKTLRELIDEFRCGACEGNVKTVLAGHKFFNDPANTVVDMEFPLGSGLIIPISADMCMADMVRLQLDKIWRASCGKCTFCREGSRQLFMIFRDITCAKGTPKDLDMISEIGGAMYAGSLCSLGQTAADCALAAADTHKDELDSHIRRKVCPAEVCTAFKNIYIRPDICDGCGECIDVCKSDAIEGKDGFIHMIDTFSCAKCGKCIEACPLSAVVSSSGRLPPLPGKLTKAGRFR